MAVVHLLPALFARRVQSRAVGHHDVVAAVGRRVPDRLVLAISSTAMRDASRPREGGVRDAESAAGRGRMVERAWCGVLADT